MMKLTLDNLPEWFETFELPEDLHERLMVLSKMAAIFTELHHQLVLALAEGNKR